MTAKSTKSKEFELEIKHLKAELKKVEAIKRQWLATIDALSDPLMIVSTQYLVKKANRALAGMARKDVKSLIGKKCFKVFADRSSPCVGCSLKETIKSGGNCSFELTQSSKDKIFEVSSEPLLDQAGKVEGVVHIYRDRTDARKMQAKLAQRDKLASIGLLAGGIAHEINNPLGGILIFSQMLLRELPKDSPHYVDVEEIEAATQRCKVIVEGLLGFARQSDGQKPSQVIDLREVIEASLRFGKVSIPKSSDIDVEVRISQNNIPVIADRNRMIQLFLNLIQNAIFAMPKGGSLTISDRVSKPGFITIDVTDTGIGIEQKHIDRIFDPFFTTKEPGEGTGLGLSQCHTIIAEIQGEIAVKSKVGKGTTFSITVPLMPRKSRAHADKKAS